ncbi:hypothetical protein C487_18713 [Natrinema pallidum DSM 3751]|uniref:Uncharacterized protein n=1 Tax=Natrinema pallidum DSM 3751 TaxID=1227495 RepID=L9YEG5_9EURY|nr:hypothetical protein C487_18713 [Natrinema pallidum DSM 3751]
MGTVVEYGTHDEVLAMDGPYATLWAVKPVKPVRYPVSSRRPVVPPAEQR